MNRKPTAERREDILDAAARVLLRDGVASLTMATLAAEVGVTSGALFRHFETRDAILVALAERTAERLLADLCAPREGTPRERLQAFVEARLGTVAKTPSAPLMVLSPDVHLALPKEGREALGGVVRATHAHVRGLISDGQREGEFREDVSAESAAVMVLGAMALRALTRVLPAALAGTKDASHAVITMLSARDGSKKGASQS
jgi:AcrR family transcriptional regulator